MPALPCIQALEVWPLNIELLEPFGIAGGAQAVAENALVRLTLDDGSVGVGEAAPFPAVNGETQAGAIAAVTRVTPALIGRPARFRTLARWLEEELPADASARCALETACLDALARRARLSLWALFGAAEDTLTTDITIPTGDERQAERAARRAAAEGFGVLKLKVGGGPLERDAARFDAAARAAPDARFILDANASMTASDALTLLDKAGAGRPRIALFEQPCAADDLEGMRAVRRHGRVRVAADESATRREDVARLAVAQAADVINLKIMKSGLVAALDMAQSAKGQGLGLMIGGMVESRLAMTVSACLAGGLGGFEHVDLDTPLFMRNSPVLGGFEQTGAELGLLAVGHGHGVRLSQTGGLSAKIGIE